MGCAQSVFLPQNDPKPTKRAANLLKAQMKYQLEQKTFGLNAHEQEVVNIVNIPPMVSVEFYFSITSLYFEVLSSSALIVNHLFTKV